MRATTSQQAGGAITYTLDYQSDGLTVRVSDPLGAQRLLQQQNIGGKILFAGASAPCADCSGDAAAKTFDANGNVTQRTDYVGVTSRYHYDSRHLPIAYSIAAGTLQEQSTNVQWDANFRLPVLVTESGRTTSYTYDSLGNPLNLTIVDTQTSESRTWRWTYNTQGQVTTATDPKASTWSYAYDGMGNRIGVTNPKGETTSYSYDAAGRVLGSTAPNGLVTTYTYDLRGRVTSAVRGGEQTTCTYTPTGLLSAATLADGYAISFGYDAAHRLISAQDNRGASVQYTLDGLGNRVRTEVRDPNGNIALAASRVINTLNQVTAVQGAAGQTAQLAYDANGELVAQTDPLNQTTRQTLDNLRRPTATTFADNATASQAWNQLDQLTQVTDPKGVATVYTYNAFGDVVTETSPDIGTIRYTRDAAGYVINTQDAKGQITRIDRDALGRPITITYADGKGASFTYDSLGFVSAITDASGSTAYTRDLQGRVLTKTIAINDNPSSPTQYKVTYEYTSGDLTAVTYPSGLKVSYARTAGRVTQVSVATPRATTTAFASNISYTPLGQPKAWTWSNGDSARRSFDADGRMTANEFASYTYDAASRITGVTQQLWTQSGRGSPTPTPITWTAGYDVRNRLMSFARAGASSTFTYDANSNRLTGVETTSSSVDLDAQFTTCQRSA